MISFLTAVLGDHLRHPISHVRIAPTEIASGKADGKTVRFDVCCELDSGERIDIEMQVLDQHNIVKRSLVYESILYLRGLKAGDKYADRQPAYCINILNFELEQTRGKVNPRTCVGLFDEETKTLFSDDQKIYFLEIPKFAKQLKYKEVSELTPLERWMAFFIRGLTFAEREKLAGKEKAIMTSIENARFFTESDAARMQYYDAIVDEMDRKSLYSAGEQKASERIALNLLSDGLPISRITNATGVSEKAIRELAKEKGVSVL